MLRVDQCFHPRKLIGNYVLERPVSGVAQLPADVWVERRAELGRDLDGICNIDV